MSLMNEGTLYRAVEDAGGTPPRYALLQLRETTGYEPEATGYEPRQRERRERDDGLPALQPNEAAFGQGPLSREVATIERALGVSISSFQFWGFWFRFRVLGFRVSDFGLRFRVAGVSFRG